MTLRLSDDRIEALSSRRAATLTPAPDANIAPSDASREVRSAATAQLATRTAANATAEPPANHNIVFRIRPLPLIASSLELDRVYRHALDRF